MRGPADLVILIRHYEQLIKEASLHLQEAESELMDTLESMGERSTVATTSTGEQIMATVVRAERTVIDEEKLAQALGWHFAEVADLKLNRRKMEDAVRKGTIDFKTVAKYTTLKDVRPYLRFSVVQEEAEDD